MAVVAMDREQMARNASTPDEPWHTIREVGHWYSGAAEFASEVLASGKGRCLVIGSPVFEAEDLKRLGWDVTYLDCRQAPFANSVCADAAKHLPFADGYFDAVSTTCVLCHAGLGRYGDEGIPNADERILAHMCRVLKRGGVAAVTFGPVAAIAEPVVEIGTMHRVYSQAHAQAMAVHAGFTVSASRVWDTRGSRWRRIGEPSNVDLSALPDYLSLELRSI